MNEELAFALVFNLPFVAIWVGYTICLFSSYPDDNNYFWSLLFLIQFPCPITPVTGLFMIKIFGDFGHKKSIGWDIIIIAALLTIPIYFLLKYFYFNYKEQTHEIVYGKWIRKDIAKANRLMGRYN